MEKMVQDCGVDRVRDQVRDIISRLAVSDYDESTVSDIIVLLNGILSSNARISDIDNIYSLVMLIEYKLSPNTIIEVLCNEIKFRTIREGSEINRSAVSGCNEDSKYLNDKIDAYGNKKELDVDNAGRRRFVPKNDEFFLPPPGETGILYSKNIHSDRKVHVEKLLIDSEGYVIQVLDKYVEDLTDEEAENEKYEEAYTGLLKNVMEYSDLKEDEKLDAKQNEECFGNCEACEEK